jgi:hypothetical protein
LLDWIKRVRSLKQYLHLPSGLFKIISRLCKEKMF